LKLPRGLRATPLLLNISLQSPKERETTSGLEPLSCSLQVCSLILCPSASGNWAYLCAFRQSGRLTVSSTCQRGSVPGTASALRQICYPRPALSLGNILTDQGYGQAAYVYYEGTEVPMLVIANPAGILICGSTPKMEDALGAGLRRRIVEFVKNSSGEDGNRDEGR
jgi:hypothetical protein